MQPHLKFVFFVSLGLFVLGCSSGDSNNEHVDDTLLRRIIASYGLTGDPTLGRSLPSITSPLSQLGMKLFFTKALGGEFDSACVSCHHPALAGGDALSLPIGVEAVNPDIIGPGRTHPSGLPTVPRNSPTTFNLGLYDQVLFHDGRVESLGKSVGSNGDDGAGIRTPDTDFGEADSLSGPNLASAQSRFPVTSPPEMRTNRFLPDASNEEVRIALSARLSGLSGWSNEFESVFGDSTVNYERIALAIGAYERSQVFVENSFRAYLYAGDNTAMSNSAKKGALLFFRKSSEGGANCVSCHSGDFFTDEQFHVLAVPQIGVGKENGETGTNDFGRFRETGLEQDRFAFRTPALLNVTETAPYGHSGAFDSLEQIIRHHLDPAGSFASYDPSSLAQTVQSHDTVTNTTPALEKLLALQASGVSKLPTGINLSDDEMADLLAFLSTLTDPCVTNRDCVASWIPSPEQDVDGFQVRAKDGSGAPL